MKCDNCLNARRVISENGLHPVCCLSDEAAMDCLVGKKDRRILTLRSNEKDNKVYADSSNCPPYREDWSWLDGVYIESEG